MIRLRQACRKLRGWRRGGVTVLAGALAALALPPLGAWPLLFAAVPLFLAVLEGATTRRSALLLGWLFGLGYFVVAFHWIGFAFLVDADTYLWMMPFMVGGLAGGMDFPASVAPFILRGVTLAGIDSVMAPIERREAAWKLLAEHLPVDRLARLTREVPLAGAFEVARDILAGRVRGRVVVDVNH